MNPRRQHIAALAAMLVLVASYGIGRPAAQSPASASIDQPAAVPAYRQANTVAVLTVHGVIDNVTLMSLERRIHAAMADGADAIVLDINTPGGRLDSALDICHLLKDRNDTPANVVAWVNPQAYSAGTIIALACREIVVAPGSSFGDAAPIQIVPFLGVQPMDATERAKALAPLLAELIDSARRHHYDEKLVQTFVMLGQELWMVEHVRTGDRVFVDRAEYKAIFGTDPVASPNLTPTWPGGQATSRLQPYINRTIPRARGGASADPQRAQNIEQFEQSLPPARQPLTDADRGQWRLVMQVSDGTSLLTVKPDEAIFYGLASGIAADEKDLQQLFGAQRIVRYDQTWSEGLVRFLVSWPVRGLLIVIFLVSLFIELAAPGFGVFGAAAAVSLLVLVGAPALVGMAQWWDLLLIGAGMLLIAIELFLLPGVGLAGVLGALCLLVGLVGTFVSGDVRNAGGQQELLTGLMATLLAMFTAGVLIWLISRQIHSLPLLNRIVLHTELREPSSRPGLLEAMGAAQRVLQPGDTGLAETDLRPAGRANFNGRLVDVKSVGSFIDRGAPVRVMSVGRFVIEVEEA